ncbi:MAG: hypothetical protein LUE13_06540 [Akkermansiaceae bacterium]|nr:hypothetical protein [Akkermansiaceae bacterium]
MGDLISLNPLIFTHSVPQDTPPRNAFPHEQEGMPAGWHGEIPSPGKKKMLIILSNHITNILTFPEKNLYFLHRLCGTRRKSKRP